jgi:hypothetical protein
MRKGNKIEIKHKDLIYHTLVELKKQISDAYSVRYKIFFDGG